MIFNSPSCTAVLPSLVVDVPSPQVIDHKSDYGEICYKFVLWGFLSGGNIPPCNEQISAKVFVLGCVTRLLCPEASHAT